jgi:hypothetical protein
MLDEVSWRFDMVGSAVKLSAIGLRLFVSFFWALSLILPSNLDPKTLGGLGSSNY